MWRNCETNLVFVLRLLFTRWSLDLVFCLLCVLYLYHEDDSGQQYCIASWDCCRSDEPGRPRRVRRWELWRAWVPPSPRSQRGHHELRKDGGATKRSRRIQRRHRHEQPTAQGQRTVRSDHRQDGWPLVWRHRSRSVLVVLAGLTFWLCVLSYTVNFINILTRLPLKHWNKTLKLWCTSKHLAYRESKFCSSMCELLALSAVGCACIRRYRLEIVKLFCDVVTHFSAVVHEYLCATEVIPIARLYNVIAHTTVSPSLPTRCHFDCSRAVELPQHDDWHWPRYLDAQVSCCVLTPAGPAYSLSSYTLAYCKS